MELLMHPVTLLVLLVAALLILFVRWDRKLVKQGFAALQALNKKHGTNFMTEGLAADNSRIQGLAGAVYFDFSKRKIAVIRPSAGKPDIEVQDIDHIVGWESLKSPRTGGPAMSYFLSLTFEDLARPVMKVQLGSEEELDAWCAKLELLINRGVAA